MDSDQRVYVWLSVFGEIIQHSVWAANYFAQELSYELGAQIQVWLIFDYLLLSSIHQIPSYRVELLNSCVE